jgi:hypothetical protein
MVSPVAAFAVEERSVATMPKQTLAWMRLHVSGSPFAQLLLRQSNTTAKS